MVEKRQTWNLEALKEIVVQLHGEEIAEKANECVQSLFIRKDYMFYHFWEVKNLLADELSQLDSMTVIEKYILVSSQEDYSDKHWKLIRAEANLIAFLQSVHACHDHLAHVIYFSLNFDADSDRRLRENEININKVGDKLGPSLLKDAINSLRNDETMKYVTAIVNTSKHRRIIQAGISVNFIVNDPISHGQRFSAFEYRTKRYPQQWAMPLIEKAFYTFQDYMFEIAELLHEELDIEF